MNIIAFYVQAKEKENKEIAMITAKLYLEGVYYDKALEIAKEMYYGELRIKS